MKAAITLNQANGILDTVISAGNFQLPRPAEEDAIIKSAAEVLKQAETARRAGVATDAVRTVIEIGSNPLYESELDILPEIFDNNDIATTATDDPPWDVIESKVNAIVDHEEVQKEIDNDSSEGTAAISTDAIPLERDQEQEPSHIELPTLPRDFSKVNDLELRSLHAERHGILSKVIFELGLEESDYQSAQVNYDTALKAAFGIATEDKVTEKREAAYFDPAASDWRDKVDAHHKKVIVLRSYKELLESEIKGLSREFTMRTGERTATP